MAQEVFISSTAVDLKEYRVRAAEVCQRLDLHAVVMERFPATPEDAVVESLAKLQACDVYVGIFAYRYGSTINGYDRSVTELEYIRAGELDIPRLCFLVQPGTPWDVDQADQGEAKEKLERLKREITGAGNSPGHPVNTFNSVDQFETKLVASLAHWQRNQPAAPDGARPGRAGYDRSGDGTELNERIQLTNLCSEQGVTLQVLLDCYQRVIRSSSSDRLRDRAAVLTKVIGATGDANDIPPVLAFAIWLEQLGPNADHGERTRRWVDDAARRRKLDPNTIAGARALIAQRVAATPPVERLRVQIRPPYPGATDIGYSLTVERRRADGSGEPSFLVGLDVETTYDLPGIRALVSESMHRWAAACNNQDDQLTVEFLVPRPLLDEEFHLWPVAGEYGLPLGVRYGVLVRDLDRMQRAELHDDWRLRWQSLQDGAAHGDVFGWVDPCAVTVQSFVLDLIELRWACLGFTHFSGEKAVRELVSAGLDQGVPAMVWIGQASAAAEPLAELRKRLQSEPLPRLPMAVRQIRRDAARAAGDQPGRHLALLWDDPATTLTEPYAFAEPITMEN